MTRGINYTEMNVIMFLIYSFATHELDCDIHTAVFTEHGSSNENNYYFVNKTYGRNLGIEICTVNEGTKSFRNVLNKQMPCNGAHCQPNASTSWGCLKNNSQECYNVEHIIPVKHNISELLDCNANIYGNLIMAYGLWNQQLGNTHYAEKKLIYGNVFDEAYKAVYWCCKNHTVPNSIPVPNCPPVEPRSANVGMIILFVLFVIGILLCVGLNIKFQSNGVLSFA